jgi:enterochelin esterase-like enzyme
MAELFDGPIENILETIRRQRFRKRVFAYEMLIENRIMQGGGTPITEGNTAYFFYRNEAEDVISVIGDWNGWKLGADIMQRIHPASTVYYLKKEFPINARLSYRFLSEDRGSFNDPANPNSMQEVFGNNTYLRMPGYEEPKYVEIPSRPVPHGVLKTLQIKTMGRSDNFSREVTIYIPHGMRMRGKVRFLYVHDGAQAITIGRFLDVLDNLYHYEPHTQKIIVVFVPPMDRHGEYMMNPKFARWNARTLVPQVEKFLKVSSTAALRAISGSSLGGLIAVYAALMHPSVFGNVAAQSASFWFDEKAIIKGYTLKKKLAVKFYIQTGTINDALEGSHEMLKILQQKGYDVTYRETNESHNWANWSAKYAEIIKWAGAINK